MSWIDNHFETYELFIVAAVVLLAAIRLVGAADLSVVTILSPAWGYFTLMGILVRFQEYIA